MKLMDIIFRRKNKPFWCERDKVIYSMSINVSLCKTEKDFQDVLGKSTSQYIKLRKEFRVHEFPTYKYIGIWYVDDGELRVIDRDTFKLMETAEAGNVGEVIKVLDKYDIDDE